MVHRKTLVANAAAADTRLARRRILAAAAGIAMIDPTRLAAAAVRHHAAAQPPAKPHEEEAPPHNGPATIDGFRSARFGMTEEEVRQAVRKDFPGAAAKLVHTTNLSEKTTVLIVAVDNLMADSGPARISYILGYASKKLIQVNVNWASDGKTENADQEVVATANKLRDYFVAEGFAANTVLVNRKLGNDALLVFRAADAAGHVVAVILSGTGAAARTAGKPAPSPMGLELAYIEHSAHPDIFRLPKGMF